MIYRSVAGKTGQHCTGLDISHATAFRQGGSTAKIVNGKGGGNSVWAIAVSRLKMSLRGPVESFQVWCGMRLSILATSLGAWPFTI